jgi:hypothetical protein
VQCTRSVPVVSEELTRFNHLFVLPPPPRLAAAAQRLSTSRCHTQDSTTRTMPTSHGESFVKSGLLHVHRVLMMHAALQRHVLRSTVHHETSTDFRFPDFLAHKHFLGLSQCTDNILRSVSCYTGMVWPSLVCVTAHCYRERLLIFLD